LLVILVLLAGLVIFDEPDNEIVQPRGEAHSAPSAARSTPESVSEDSPLLALRVRQKSESGIQAHHWSPPQPQPPPPPPPPILPPESFLPPPPVAAPPLLFEYLGKQQEDGKWTVFLAHQEQMYIVREGGMIESDYRVEKIAPPMLTVTYLPLRQRQTFDIGPAE
jgi:hypothetical protein